MSEPRRLSDAELLAQLRRRRSDERATSDLWRNDFTRGVRAKIDAGVQPRRRGAPALVGLAGAVAIVVVLAVALPVIRPGPTTTTAPLDPMETPTSVAAPTDTPRPAVETPDHRATDPAASPAPSMVPNGRAEMARCGFEVVVVDYTGLLDRCVEMFPTPEVPGITPGDDPKAVSVAWIGSLCKRDTVLQLSTDAGGYRIDAFETDDVGPRCDSGDTQRAVYLRMTTVIDTALIRMGLDGRQVAPNVALPEDGPALPDPLVRYVPCSPPARPDHLWTPRMNSTIRDTTGLVETCETFMARLVGDSVTVTNGKGDTPALEIRWAGAPCSALRDFDFARDGTRISLTMSGYGMPCIMPRVVHGVRIHLRDFVPAESVRLELIGANLPDSQLPPGVSLGSWELAAHETPSSETTQLDVIVYSETCPGAGSADHIRDVAVLHSYAISITVTVAKTARDSLCAGSDQSVGTPYTIQLSEPIGDRVLIDAGAQQSIFEWSDQGLPIFSTERGEQMAVERVRARLGADACFVDHHSENVAPTQSELERMVDGLGRFRGFVDHGRAYVGSFGDAALAFGAVEAYTDNYQTYLFLGPAGSLPVDIAGTAEGSLAITQLTDFWVSDGRQIWYPAFSEVLLVSPAPCSTSAP